MEMTSKNDLLIGFQGHEKQRISKHLEKLLRHISTQNFVIVGGIAIRYHIISHQLKYSHRPLNDVDILVKHPNDIKPGIKDNFLIYHYHPYRLTNQEDKFFIALVDKENKIKTDIFDFYFVAPQELTHVSWNNHIIKLRSIEDQLVNTVREIYRVTEGIPHDPKQFQDAEMLFSIADQSKVQKFWQNWTKSQSKYYPSNFKLAFTNAKQKVKQNPQLLVKHVNQPKNPKVCENCINNVQFPITSPDKIFSILGYH